MPGEPAGMHDEWPDRRFRDLFLQSGIPQAVIALDGTIAAVNEAACSLFDRRADELVGEPLLSRLPHDGLERSERLLEDLLEGRVRRAQFEHRLLHRDGTSIDALVSAAAIQGPNNELVELSISLQDITALKALERKRLREALEDPLTQLPNRALLMDRIGQAVERELAGNEPYSLLFVNIDRLAAINDSFGHAAGDEVLRAVADTLCGLVRPGDTVARYAGDEFAVLICHPEDPHHAVAVAERAAAALNTTLLGAGWPELHYTASVGLAHGPADTAEALVSAASAAATRAKEFGRGRWHVLGDSARHQMAEQRALGAELTAAVAANGLSVHYQPIVDLRSGNVTAFEALVRWPHPRRGELAPHSFLPLAEALDLQIRIDEWVLREACATATTWPQGDLGPISVAVNVSPAHLTTPGFAAKVCETLRESGLDAGQLALEITETAVVADLALAADVLTTLSEIGVHVSIDDFGTGYSSMLQLRQLPFDKLKIDREFVRALPHSVDDLSICASVVSLASRLGVHAIAEGIEQETQVKALDALGCHYGQGFLWSGAVPASETHQMISATPWLRPTKAGDPRTAAKRNSPSSDPVVLQRARDLHESGASLNTIAASLNRAGSKTHGGLRWHAASVARLLFPQGGS
ncbi:MAG: hypothetical protein QOJ92_2245 [Frankiales bacterium]|nr:hypothetical protein [Frankiales bacterium]